MRRYSFIVLIVLAIVAGFMTGRFSVNSSLVDFVIPSKKVYPVPPTPPKPPPVIEKNVILETPADSASVNVNFIVSGRAKKSATPIGVIVKDENGSVLMQTASPIVITDSASYGRFSAGVVLPGGYLGATLIELLWTDSQPGGQSETIIRKVVVGKSDTLSIKVYLVPSLNTCASVEPQSRMVSTASVSVYQAALTALFAGPTATEKSQGYSTALTTNGKVRSVAVDGDGVLTVDFFGPIVGAGASGTCRMSTAKAQIMQTLAQFLEVRTVVITVKGKPL